MRSKVLLPFLLYLTMVSCSTHGLRRDPPAENQPLGQEVVDVGFNKVDANNDGNISREEYVYSKETTLKNRRKNHWIIFLTILSTSLLICSVPHAMDFWKILKKNRNRREKQKRDGSSS